LKKTPPIPRMRPRCSILTGGFDVSGCGDCTSCPPFEQIEMSNSEPSVIVRQGIPCMCGLYIDLVRRATCYQRKTLKPRYPASGSRAARDELAQPLERISEPQISPTRLNSIVKASRPMRVAIPRAESCCPFMVSENWNIFRAQRIAPCFENRPWDYR